MSDRAGIRSRRRVEFADTDASGRAHFAALLRHVEAVEHEWLAGRGVPLIGPDGGWPRVRVECDYRAPVGAGEEIEVALDLRALGESSVEWGFVIEKASGGVVAEGGMVTVRVDAAGRPAAIPDEWRALLGG